MTSTKLKLKTELLKTRMKNEFLTRELSKERGQRLKLRASQERIKRDYEAIKEQLAAHLRQRKFFYAGFCSHLVKVRKAAPKQVPKSYLEKINGVIRRIRKAETIPLKIDEKLMKELEK